MNPDKDKGRCSYDSCNYDPKPRKGARLKKTGKNKNQRR